MAFITPFCTSFPSLQISLAMLLLAGCTPDDADFGFRLERIETHMTANALNVEIHQELVLSREAKNALNHGVPLTIQTEFSLRAVGSRREISQQSNGFEIRYLPLSDHYQLTSITPFKVSTYPRLRHVLAELASVNFVLPATTIATGEFELQARSFLERRHMPPPMRLPVWFSAQWQHDSGWQIWPLARAPGT